MYERKIQRNDYCPTERLMDIVGGKWKSRIICLLSIQESLRFRQIREMTPGISDNVLSQVLKELVSAQLVERQQFNEVPLRVEYCLTEQGRSLMPILHSMCRWVYGTYGPEACGNDNCCPYRKSRLDNNG